MEYPKWIYHKEEKACIVKNAEEHKQKGAGWHESPADCKEAKNEEVKKPVTKAKVKKKAKA